MVISKITQNLFLIILYLLLCINLNAQWHAVYIPKEKLEKIRIDGCDNDWNWVPEKYIIKTDKLINVLNKNMPNEQNFKCKLIIGWNDVTNLVYIIAVVKDDVISSQLQPDRAYYLNDCIEFASSSLLYQNFQSILYYDKDDHYCQKGYLIETPFQKEEIHFPTGHNWLLDKKGEYIQWGATCKNNVIIYELGMYIWDYLDIRGEVFSKQCILMPNKKISLTIVFNDMDKDKSERNAQWATTWGTEWYNRLNDLSTFLLDPPMEDKINWYNIEAIIKSKDN